MSSRPCVGLCVVMTSALGLFACRHAHERVAVDGEGTQAIAEGGGAHDRAVVGTAPADEHAAPAEAPMPEAARIGPIHLAAPFVFVPHPGTATLARITKTLRAAVVGTTAALRVEIGCPDGATVVDGEKTTRLPLAKEEARAIAIGPADTWIAVELASTRVAVFARDDLRRLGTWNGREPIALASDLLVLRDECRWIGVDPATPAAPAKVLAEDVCGEVIHVDAPGRRLSIAETSHAGAEATAGVRAIVEIGDAGEPVRRELATDAPLASPAMSADGKILCGVLTVTGKPILQCRPTAGGAFERVAQDVVGPLRFASDAPRLAFAVAVRASRDAFDLHVVDFEQRLVRRLARVHQHRFAFLPGGEHLVAYEGGRGFVFELESGFLVPFGGREDDWVGVVALPGTHDSFLATRLRKRCADLVRVELPKDSP